MTLSPRKRVIGIDFDDVIIDWNTALIEHYNSLHGTSHERKNILSYDLEKFWGGSAEEAISTVLNFYSSDQHINITPIPGALEAIKQLAAHELVIITSRPDSARPATEAWLKKIFQDYSKESTLPISTTAKNLKSATRQVSAKNSTWRYSSTMPFIMQRI